MAICMLNLFLGWTFVGWVAALIWAIYKEKAETGVKLPRYCMVIT